MFCGAKWSPLPPPESLGLTDAHLPRPGRTYILIDPSPKWVKSGANDFRNNTNGPRPTERPLPQQQKAFFLQCSLEAVVLHLFQKAGGLVLVELFEALLENGVLVVFQLLCVPEEGGEEGRS